ncbi:MAG: hypothetical protein IM613_20790 [Cytophagales bacterium]|nr:hypothetical protein [Cytophagales bacterium]
MKTSLLKPALAVLTDHSEDKEVVAIISCKPDSDVTDSLQQAILDHFCAESVSVNTNGLTIDLLEPVHFSATILDDSGDPFSRNYSLEIASVY